MFAHILRLNVQNCFNLLLQLLQHSKFIEYNVLSAPLFVAAVSFFVARVEFQVGVLAPEVFRCQIFPCKDLQSAFLCLLFCSICTRNCLRSTPIVNIVSQTLNEQVSSPSILWSLMGNRFQSNVA